MGKLKKKIQNENCFGIGKNDSDVPFVEKIQINDMEF